MTKVTVRSGVCGFTVTVTAQKTSKRKVRLSFETDCEMVQAMAKELGELDVMAAFTGFSDNPVYRSAARHLKHVACPVPSGILKALEAESGLALPRDASIIFEKEKT